MPAFRPPLKRSPPIATWSLERTRDRHAMAARIRETMISTQKFTEAIRKAIREAAKEEVKELPTEEVISQKTR